MNWRHQAKIITMTNRNNGEISPVKQSQSGLLRYWVAELPRGVKVTHGRISHHYIFSIVNYVFLTYFIIFQSVTSRIDCLAKKRCSKGDGRRWRWRRRSRRSVGSWSFKELWKVQSRAWPNYQQRSYMQVIYFLRHLIHLGANINFLPVTFIGGN